MSNWTNMKEYFSWSIKKVKEEIGLPDIVVNNAGSYYLQVEETHMA